MLVAWYRRAHMVLLRSDVKLSRCREATRWREITPRCKCCLEAYMLTSTRIFISPADIENHSFSRLRKQSFDEILLVFWLPCATMVDRYVWILLMVLSILIEIGELRFHEYLQRGKNSVEADVGTGPSQ